MNFHVTALRFFLLSCLFGVPVLSHAGLMCFSNNLGNTGTTSACGDTTGAPVASQTNTQGGNPIDLLSGNKYQREDDFPSLPGAQGLEFRRSYNSQSRERGILGYGWRSTYELRLQDSDDKIQILQSDGKRISFEVKAFPFEEGTQTSFKTSTSIGSGLYVNRCVSSRPEDGWVERIPKGGWVWHLPSGDAYRFDVDTSVTGASNLGRLVAISNANHHAWTTLSYSAKDGKLISIVDRAGRKVILTYEQTKYHLPKISVVTPIGQYEYFQDQYGNLSQVVYPDGRRVGYAYDPRYRGGDPHNITDKFQYVMTTDPKTQQKTWQKKLLGHWQYDSSDRATLSEHADGIERLVVAYDTKSVLRPLVTTDKNQRFNNTITNSLGQKTIYTYHIDATRYLVDRIVGAGCATCGESNIAYTYNSGGQIKIQQWLAQDGSVLRTMTHDYDAFGRVISTSVKSEGVDEAAHSIFYTYVNNDLHQTNTRSQGWLVKTISEASILPGKQKVTTYDYDAAGNKISETEMGYTPTGEILKRQTKYGYTQEGKLAWEDGPLPNGKTNSPKDSDVTVYEYDDKGRLHDLIAPADQKITVSAYDIFNRPTEIRVKDGTRIVTMNNVYLPNSSLLAQMSMTAEGVPAVLQQYRYDAQNRLIQIQKGQLITTFGYDASGRRAVMITPDGVTHKTQLDSENRVIRQETLLGKALLQQVSSEYLQNSSQTDMQGNPQITLFQSDLIGKIAKFGHENQYLWQEDRIGRVQLEQRDAQNRTRTKQLLQANTTTISSLLATAKPLSAGFKQDFSKGAIRQQQASLVQDGLYDDFGRLVIKNQPAQGLSLFKYDAADNITAQINGKGQIEFRHYDAASRLVAIGNQPDVKAAALLISYDGIKIIKKVSPTETQIWQYRADGLTTKHTRKLYLPKSAKEMQSVVLTKSRDNATVQPTRTWTHTWNYDENGFIRQESRHGLVLSYERDSLGRPTRIETHADNGLMDTVGRWLHLNTYIVSNIHYTPLGLLAGYTTSTGRVLSRTYDNRGRLRTQTWREPQAGAGVMQQVGNWLKPKSISHTDAYVYDGVNRLIYSSETGGHYYQYDAKDQLIAEWQIKADQQSNKTPGNVSAWEVTHQYAYDAQGNRRMYWAKYDQSEPSSKGQPAFQETLTRYHYADGGRNPNNQVLLLGADKTALTLPVKALQTAAVPSLDSSGLPHLSRLIGYGETGQPAAWWQTETPFNHLSDYARSIHGSPIYNTTQDNWMGEDRDQSKVLIEQGKDINGMPLYKRARLKNGTLSDSGLNDRGFEQINGYENGQRLWEEQRLSLPREVNQSQNRVDLILSRDYIMLAGLPIFQHTMLNGDGEYSDIEFNRIGAPVAVYDQHNQQQWQIAYGAFGEKLNTQYNQSPSALQVAAIRKQADISQNANDLRYAVSLRLPGQNEDPLTGLYDNGHRQYDPQMGRYLTPDPAGTPDGLNPYLYVNNNPINSIDPLGLYQTDMHYYMTYFLAITAGIDSDNARRIALAAQFVDVNDNTSPLPEGTSTSGLGAIIDLPHVEFNNATTNRLDWYHFTNNREYYESVGDGHDLGSWDLEKPRGMTDEAYLTWRLTSYLDKVPQLQKMTQNYKTAAGCKNMNLSMQFFGEYLHAFEDTFAHRDKTNDPYGTNGGIGHTFGDENPDYTFNHLDSKGILGNGEWKNNQDRTLVAEQQIYKKLVEYRQNTLKISDDQTKTVPLESLERYLSVFNAIPEHSNDKAAGSLDGWKDKIQYLQDLLNGQPTSVTTYKKDANGLVDPEKLTPDDKKSTDTATNWGLTKKGGGKFLLIRDGNVDDGKGKGGTVSGKVADIDGFSVPQAISNRISVFKDLTNAQTEIYQNVIWDTYVKDYKSHDDVKVESLDIVSSVKNYRLSAPLLGSVFSKPTDKAFKVVGTSPLPAQQ